MENQEQTLALEKFVSYNDLRENLGIHRNTVNLAISKGELPSPLKFGGRYVFNLREVEECIKRQSKNYNVFLRYNVTQFIKTVEGNIFDKESIYNFLIFLVCVNLVSNQFELRKFNNNNKVTFNIVVEKNAEEVLVFFRHIIKLFTECHTFFEHEKFMPLEDTNFMSVFFSSLNSHFKETIKLNINRSGERWFIRCAKYFVAVNLTTGDNSFNNKLRETVFNQVADDSVLMILSNKNTNIKDIVDRKTLTDNMFNICFDYLSQNALNNLMYTLIHKQNILKLKTILNNICFHLVENNFNFSEIQQYI